MLKNISADTLRRMEKRFSRLYGPALAPYCAERAAALLGRYGVGYNVSEPKERWNEQTAVLITYGDTIRTDNEVPLHTLRRFLTQHLNHTFSHVHILPFFPYSSDDGFSIIDYREVNPELGSWKDLEALGNDFRLMFDLVLNHVSSQSSWFQDYCNGIAPARNWFIEKEPDTDLSAVVRPRNLPLLTEVQTILGPRRVWTTFSDDQIDLNFADPDVLFEFLDLLLYFISRKARMIRLDAIAYLWKAAGTSCIHLPQTHEIVKIMRALLEMAAPDVILLTETNVPHEENISYFGDGDEAHMIYQFCLPPLLLHGLINGTAAHLSNWLEKLDPPAPGCTCLNFTASHDGIGVRPLQGLIDHAELDTLLAHVKARGGHVSTKQNSDGSESPYELNIAYYDALGKPDDTDALHRARFLCSQIVALSLQGVPAVYFHSLTGTRNDHAGVRRTGRARSINRHRWQHDELEHKLNENGPHAAVFEEYRQILRTRRRHSAFHPDAAQQIIRSGDSLLTFIRRNENDGNAVAVLCNFSDQPKTVTLGPEFAEFSDSEPCTDLLSGNRISGSPKKIELAPCQCVWLRQ